MHVKSNKKSFNTDFTQLKLFLFCWTNYKFDRNDDN